MGGLRTLPATLGCYHDALCSWEYGVGGRATAAGCRGGHLPQAVFPIVIVGALGASSVVAEL